MKSNIFKKAYLVIQIEENKKYYAYFIETEASMNLLSYLIVPKNQKILTVNIAQTKQKAIEICNFWNECFKNNNTILYGGLKNEN